MLLFELYFQIAFFKYILKKDNVETRGFAVLNVRISYLRGVFFSFITKMIQLLIKDKMFFRKRKIVLSNIFLQFVFV